MTDGEDLRDRGINAVLAATPEDWQADYYRLVAKWFWALPVGATFQGEALRLAALEQGLRQPEKYHSWGGVSAGYLRALRRLGFIEEIGTSRATSARSHAHSYRMYRKLGGARQAEAKYSLYGD